MTSPLRFWPLLALALLSGCFDSTDDSSSPPRKSSSGSTEKNTKVVIESVDEKPTIKGKGRWSLFRKRDRHHHKQYTNPAIDTFWRADYEKLEAMAEKYRTEKTLRNDGGWALSSFYKVFDDYSDINQVNPERYYPKMERMLKEWREKYPESPTPHVALIGFYVGYAWFARGDGYASSVTEENFQLFQSRLKEAEKIALEYPQGKTDPQYFRAVMRMGLGLGWPMEKIEGVFAEGRKVEPEFWEIYHGAAYHQLPRWYGENHREWHSWLKVALEEAELPGELKDEFYAQICLRMVGFAYDHPNNEPDMFEAAGVDWDRLHRGGEILMTKFPESTKIPSRYLRAAVQAGDYETGRSIVKRMNYVFDGMEWWGDHAYEFYEIVSFLEEDGARQKETAKGGENPPESEQKSGQ